MHKLKVFFFKSLKSCILTDFSFFYKNFKKTKNWVFLKSRFPALDSTNFCNGKVGMLASRGACPPLYPPLNITMSKARNLRCRIGLYAMVRVSHRSISTLLFASFVYGDVKCDAKLLNM